MSADSGLGLQVVQADASRHRHRLPDGIWPGHRHVAAPRPQRQRRRRGRRARHDRPVQPHESRLARLAGFTDGATTTQYGWAETLNRTSVQVGAGTPVPTTYDDANRPLNQAGVANAFTSGVAPLSWTPKSWDGSPLQGSLG
jgi:hypothetical protein